MKRTLAYLVAFLLAAGPARAGKTKSDEASSSGSDDKPAAAAPSGEEEDKEFKDVVKDMAPIEGLFTFYRDDDKGKVYLEVKPDQLDKVFLCSVTREAGDGYYFDSASMIGEFPIVLSRVGKTVRMLHRNVYFRAAEGAAIRGAIDRGVSDSLLGTAPILAKPHPERGSLLLDPTSFFLQDIAWVGFAFQEWKDGPKYSLDAAASHLGATRSFPRNAEVDAVLYFRSEGPKPAPTIPDARSFRHVYRYSLSSLPEGDFRPRIADDRVGHFLTLFQDYTSLLKDTPYVRYVTRWHLVKSEPRLPLSPPREPIVFWLENTIPVEYRDAVREGILLWNRAFEKIGFQDAIVVQQQPDDADWDPADVRYTTVRWMVMPGAGYAVGPSRANPFTGQLYDADIRVSADMVRYAMLGHEELASPLATPARARLREVRTPWLAGMRGSCDHAEGLVEQAAFGWSVLEARGQIEPLSPAGQRFIHDFLVDLIAHEVGHTLGLRHNFKGTLLNGAGDLEDAARTSAIGISSSVMDYVPVNIAAPGRPQGEYFQTTLGPYDLWAIEYAYKPIEAGSPEGEMAALDQIASRSADPQLAYGTDEDAFDDPRGVDPSCTRWDLGTDGIEYYRRRAAVAKELWGKMEASFEKDGERYPRLRRVFGRAFNQVWQSVGGVTKNIGGVYARRDHVGDPSGRLPFEPVAAERQREALAYLAGNVFGPDAFRFSPELLNKLAPERWWDFTGSIWETRRIDYPLHELVLQMQSSALDELYDPVRLGRIQDNEGRFPASVRPFTMADLFGELRAAVWAELDAPASRNVGSLRRGLQRAHLARLIALVTDPPVEAPGDASALARADLVALEGKMGQAIGRGGLDPATAAHLAESRALAQAALEAGIERGIRTAGKAN